MTTATVIPFTRRALRRRPSPCDLCGRRPAAWVCTEEPEQHEAGITTDRWAVRLVCGVCQDFEWTEVEPIDREAVERALTAAHAIREAADWLRVA